MPPLESFPKSTHQNYGGGGQNYLSTDSFVTTPLLESISKSKSKLQKWVDHEKLKMDSTAASYREKLAEHKRIIHTQAEELFIVQKERGMDSGVFEDRNGTSDCNSNVDHARDIAAQKRSLDDNAKKIQIEIIKLKTERDNKEKRVHGKSESN